MISSLRQTQEKRCEQPGPLLIASVALNKAFDVLNWEVLYYVPYKMGYLCMRLWRHISHLKVLFRLPSSRILA